MKNKDNPYHEIGTRLKLLRLGKSDLGQAEWATMHNFGVTQYNNWENGVRRIPIEAAEKLCDRYSLTLDAIYRGNFDGLSPTSLKILSGADANSETT